MLIKQSVILGLAIAVLAVVSYFAFKLSIMKSKEKAVIHIPSDF